MSEFDGLSKHPNNPACTESVKSLQRVEAEHYMEQAEEEEENLLASSATTESIFLTTAWLGRSRSDRVPR